MAGKPVKAFGAIQYDDFAVAQTCRAVAITQEIRLSPELWRDESREPVTVLINKLCWLLGFTKGRAFIF